jgi:hypothetical protein
MHETSHTESAAWAARDRATALLVQQQPLFEAVVARVSPLWHDLTAGKTFPRKPSLSLRLFAADAATLIGVSPHYQRHTHTVECHHLLLEVIAEVERYLTQDPPTPFFQLKRRLILRIKPDAASYIALSGSTAVEDMAVLIAVLEQFLDNPAAVLRRSTASCAVCGRRLTDGQSQARGVGPECIRQISSWLGTTSSLFAHMESIPGAPA